MKQIKKVDVNLGRRGWINVWAVVDGVFAVHREIIMLDGKLVPKGQWVITHVPTGMGLGRHLVLKTKADVKSALEYAKSLRWNGINPLETYEACEFLNLAPMIQRDWGHDEDEVDWWVSEIREEAANALACKIQDKQH